MTTQSENKILLEAMLRLRFWLANEGCDEQREWADIALSKVGVREVRCIHCDGDGEWDVQLPATSRTQISPDYRHVVCEYCNGTGAETLCCEEVSQ